MKEIKIILALVATLALIGLAAPAAQAINFTFPTSPAPPPIIYDNTANTVTAGPVTHNNQTQGVYRDIFWWNISNGQPLVGSPDFINQGNSLILSANHAVPGPGPYSAINFTGQSISGGTTYMTIYDTTPADGATTKNTFTGTAADHLILNVDILFTKHNASGGIVALYNEGQDGLALLVNNPDGNNADHTRVNLVFQSTGAGTILQSVTLPANTFLTTQDTDNTHQHWYRIVMDLFVTGDTFNITGTFFNHTDPNDPTSALGTQIVAANINLTGSVSDPDVAALHLTSPGEIGLVAMGNESIGPVDNVGISFFGENEPTVPEPATMLLLGSGLLGLGLWGFRKKFKK